MSAAEKLQTAYARLKIVAGPHAGFETEMFQTPFTLGRGTDNDFCLDKDSKVSRLHISISVSNNAVKVTNVSQKNFLMVNGIREEERVLEGASIIQIGETTLEILPLVKVEVKRPLQLLNQTPAPTSIPTSTPNFVPQKSVTTPAWTPPPATQNWNQASPAKGPIHQAFKSPKPAKADSGKIIFYLLIAVIVAGGYFLFSDGKKKDNVDRGGFRKNTEIEQDLLASQNAIKGFETRKEQLENKSFQRAQENYIKGFRDFRLGNYARARDHFQIVLNLDPTNVLAQRYYNLSKIKYDELVQFNMIQGLTYREKKNYRLCKSSFQNVLIMIQNNPQHPKYKEANDFFRECSLGMEGRY